MKNSRLICLALLFLSSCGVTKKTIETETKLDITEIAIRKDSVEYKVSREEIFNAIIEKIDLSRAIITYYNPPDTSGRQSINRTVEYNSNIKTTATINKADSTTIDFKKGTTEIVILEDKTKQLATMKEKKKVGLPFKVYLWCFVAFLLVGGIVFFLRRFRII